MSDEAVETGPFSLTSPILERDIFRNGSDMVWGGISRGVKSQLIVIGGNLTAARYRDEVLCRTTVPHVQQGQLILQSGPMNKSLS